MNALKDQDDFFRKHLVPPHWMNTCRWFSWDSSGFICHNADETGEPFRDCCDGCQCYEESPEKPTP